MLILMWSPKYVTDRFILWLSGQARLTDEDKMYHHHMKVSLCLGILSIGTRNCDHTMDYIKRFILHLEKLPMRLSVCVYLMWLCLWLAAHLLLLMSLVHMSTHSLLHGMMLQCSVLASDYHCNKVSSEITKAGCFICACLIVFSTVGRSEWPSTITRLTALGSYVWIRDLQVVRKVCLSWHWLPLPRSGVTGQHQTSEVKSFLTFILRLLFFPCQHMFSSTWYLSTWTYMWCQVCIHYFTKMLCCGGVC